jgi:chromosome segregation ATPase
MSEPERRPVIDPSILGRMSASMDSIRAAWEADVAELNELKAKNADMERIMHSHADRLNDTLHDLANERRLNIDLVHRNAQLEADLRMLANTSLEARDHLNTLAARAEQSTQIQQAAATSAPTAPPAAPAQTDNERLHERAVNLVRQIGLDDSELDDDGTGLPPGMPEFVARDRAEFTLHTRPPANKFPS